MMTTTMTIMTEIMMMSHTYTASGSSFESLLKVENIYEGDHELHCPSFSSSQSMPWLSPSAYLLT